MSEKKQLLFNLYMYMNLNLEFIYIEYDLNLQSKYWVSFSMYKN